MDIIERNIYSVISKSDGIKAKDIARAIRSDRAVVNHYLYKSAFIKDLCYRDDEYMWHGLIRQARPHEGLSDYCGYCASVEEFVNTPYDVWFENMKHGCAAVGRNLNNTRGLFHSFEDTHRVMMQLFDDIPVDCDDWEIVFELRIRRSKHIRIYADVLVITERYVFSLEFKMNDEIIYGDVEQAAKYNEYLEVIFGPDYEIISGLVITLASDVYTYVPLKNTSAEIPVCSADMLFNIFNEYLGFYE